MVEKSVCSKDNKVTDTKEKLIVCWDFDVVGTGFDENTVFWDPPAAQVDLTNADCEKENKKYSRYPDLVKKSKDGKNETYWKT